MDIFFLFFVSFTRSTLRPPQADTILCRGRPSPHRVIRRSCCPSVMTVLLTDPATLLPPCYRRLSLHRTPPFYSKTYPYLGSMQNLPTRLFPRDATCPHQLTAGPSTTYLYTELLQSYYWLASPLIRPVPPPGKRSLYTIQPPACIQALHQYELEPLVCKLAQM